MTDFEAVAEDIYSRHEVLFRTGNLAKNIELLCKNSQNASPAIIQIAENLKIIADTNKMEAIIKDIESSTTIKELETISSSNQITNLAPEVKKKLEPSFEKVTKILKDKEASRNEIFFVEKYSEQLKSAKQPYQIVEILDKAERDIINPKNLDKVQYQGNKKLENINKEIERIAKKEAKELERLKSEDKRKRANAKRMLEKIKEREQKTKEEAEMEDRERARDLQRELEQSAREQERE